MDWSAALQGASPLLLGLGSDLQGRTKGGAIAGMGQMQALQRQQQARQALEGMLGGGKPPMEAKGGGYGPMPSGLGAGPAGGSGGAQGGLGLAPGQVQAIRAIGQYNPEAALQMLAQAQFRADPSTEWERLTQGMTPEQIAEAKKVKLGLAPSADAALRVGAQKTSSFRALTPDEAKRYGVPAGQIDESTGRIYPINPPSGMSIESDGNGGFRLQQGSGVTQKPFTEGQSKDVTYATRARGALEAFEPYANSLTSLGENAAGVDPTGLVRGAVQSDEFQIAQNAGNEFLQAILRKDTGAAITEGEQRLYGRTYLPQPGDGEAVLAEKKRARLRAIAALEAGMSPSQMIAQERGLRAGKGEGAAARPYEGMSDADLMKALGF